MPDSSFDILVKKVRACTLCAGDLKDGVRPVFQAHQSAKVLVAGQAPGSRVHASGIPFDDPSGERLRDWMGVNRKTFYDETQIALLPMAFCYPGKGKSGDLPPMPICADTWRAALLEALPHITVTLAIGQYAQAWHLPSQKGTLTETVRNWEASDAGPIPLPHPSPRNNIWLKRNIWFEKDVIPVVRRRIMQALK